MRKLRPFLILLSSMIFPFLWAEAEEPKLYPIKIDIKDKEKLQRGAKFFVNYCSGCHSLKYLRYSQMGQDLGLLTYEGDLDEPLLYNNLIFTYAKLHDPVTISMSERDAREWFGVMPPDLSLITRQRGPDWVYTYLKSFYFDPKRPFNTNNLLKPQVAMPNVLEPLSGRIVAIKKETQAQASSDPALTLMRVSDGEMTEQTLNGYLEDLITFLAYVGEPAKLIRRSIGYFVLAYLFLFLLVAYALKKLYWKKISHKHRYDEVT